MIELRGVSKRYGAFLAVRDMEFSLGGDEVVGFLGPNGAGKSTVLKMIATWMPPTSGTVRVAGHDAVREPLAVRSALGYLPEHNALYDSMIVERFLRFAGRLRGLRGATLGARIDWAIDRCELAAVAGRPIAHCSKGYRQRIGLAAALLHDPPVIVLDEPTHGLDPVQVSAFRGFVQELAPGRTILFSSHILAEVVAVCRRLLVVGGGRLLADRPLERLRDDARRAGRDLEETILEIVRPSERAA